MKKNYRTDFTFEGLRNERGKILETAKKLQAGADNEGRDLRAEEAAKVDAGLESIKEIDSVMQEMKAKGWDSPNIRMDADNQVAAKGAKRIYQPGVIGDTPDFNIGKIARAMIKPEFLADLNANERRAVVTSQGSLGGLIVPEDLSPAVIEPLRAKTVIAKNMKIEQMAHLNMTLVGIDSDVDQVAVKRETQAFSESSMSFKAARLEGKKIGTWIEVSEESLYSSNAADFIEDSLYAKAAEKLDYFAIHGSTEEEIEGLENTAGIYSNTAIGALSYGTISTEIYDLKGNNVPGPYQCFYAVDVGGFLDAVQTATDKKYATADALPKSWNDLQKWESGIIDDGYMVIGNFQKYGVIGMGGTWKIEVDPYSMFTSGVVRFRIMGFADVVFTQAGAFQVLTGITSVTDLA